MANVTVVFEYEEPEYCRLCLAEPTKNNELVTIRNATANDMHKDILSIIRDLLNIQLDAEKDAGSFICSICLESLIEFHQYRSRCQTNNDTLKTKAIERKENQIQLAKSAIHNANLLEHVKDGDPIKVIMRINAEGKGTLRIEVESKQPQPETAPPPVLPTKKLVPASSKAAAAKPMKLPNQEFYFYKTQTSKRGLIYDGFRYCVSIPRLNGTHWVCEQRKSHNCMALLYVDKTYNAFYLHSQHSHTRTQKTGVNVIYKAADVLKSVIEIEQNIRKMRGMVKENAQHPQSNSAVKDPVDKGLSKDIQIKEESDIDSEEENDEENKEIDSNYGLTVSDVSKTPQIQPPLCTVKEEPHPAAAAVVHSPPAKRIKICAGDNLYFIKELT